MRWHALSHSLPAFPTECTLSVVVGKQFKLKGYRTMVTVSALVITSDMALVDFRKTNIKFLTTKPQTYTVTAMLTKPSEHVNVYLTCELHHDRPERVCPSLRSLLMFCSLFLRHSKATRLSAWARLRRTTLPTCQCRTTRSPTFDQGPSRSFAPSDRPWTLTNSPRGNP